MSQRAMSSSSLNEDSSGLRDDNVRLDENNSSIANDQQEGVFCDDEHAKNSLCEDKTDLQVLDKVHATEQGKNVKDEESESNTTHKVEEGDSAFEGKSKESDTYSMKYQDKIISFTSLPLPQSDEPTFFESDRDLDRKILSSVQIHSSYNQRCEEKKKKEDEDIGLRRFESDVGLGGGINLNCDNNDDLLRTGVNTVPIEAWVVEPTDSERIERERSNRNSLSLAQEQAVAAVMRDLGLTTTPSQVLADEGELKSSSWENFHLIINCCFTCKQNCRPRRNIPALLVIFLIVLITYFVGFHEWPISSQEAEKAKYLMFRDIVVSSGISNAIDFEVDSNPQERALRWVVKRSVTTENFLQQYILASFVHGLQVERILPIEDIHECFWAWVGCLNNQEGSVNEILLSGIKTNNGEILSEVQHLQYLKHFEVSRAGLGGIIPSLLGNLTMLEVLNLERNNLEGPFPTFLGKLQHLEELHLGANHLTGFWHDDLWTLGNLRVLYLYENLDMGGAISSKLTMLSSLQYLDISSCNFSGSLPTSIGHMQSLKSLFIGGNPRLEGTIPTEIGDLLSLEELEIQQTLMSGTLPSEFGNLTQLQFFVIEANKFEGSIPTEFGFLEKLEVFEVANENRIYGKLPTEISNLNGLKRFTLLDIDISGSIPKELGAVQTLEKVWICKTMLSGEIPAGFIKNQAIKFIKTDLEGCDWSRCKLCD